MNVGDIVILIGREPDMPPCGTIGEIVGPLDRGDFDVMFQNFPCPVQSPEWCVPQEWLRKISGPLKEIAGWNSSWDDFVWEVT
jgi:hypothetical protein